MVLVVCVLVCVCVCVCVCVSVRKAGSLTRSLSGVSLLSLCLLLAPTVVFATRLPCAGAKAETASGATRATYARARVCVAVLAVLALTN